MKNNKVIIAAIVALTVISVAFIFRPQSNEGMRVSGISDATTRLSQIGQTGTSSSMIVGATSVQVMATSSNREYARISNLAGFAIYCNADNDKPAVGYSGIMIPATSTVEITQDFPYAGAIRCISPQGNASTTSYSASKY